MARRDWERERRMRYYDEPDEPKGRSGRDFVRRPDYRGEETYGSPYAPGRGYMEDTDYGEMDYRGFEREGAYPSPYAPEFERERYYRPRSRRDYDDEDVYRYGSPYAPRRGYMEEADYGEMQRRGFEREDDYPSPYAPEFERERYYRPRSRRDYERDFERDYESAEYYEPRERSSDIWMVPGPMSGLGPKGYQRSDEVIEEDICERLTRHGRIDARDIEVKVENNEVTLTGMVDTRSQKRMAEDVAESVWGVKDVHNRLTTRRRGETGRFETQGRFRKDMEVVGSDGKHIGKVKEIHGSSILVDREMARDIYIPMSALHEMGNKLMLNKIPADKVDEQDWKQPDIVDTGDIGGD